MASYSAGQIPRSNPVYSSTPTTTDGPYPYPPHGSPDDDDDDDSDDDARPDMLPPKTTGPKDDTVVDIRYITRTPSPTPSERDELAKPFQPFGLFSILKNWRSLIRREWLWYYVAIGIILIVTVLITVYHDQIVHWFQPYANKIHNLPAGWLIPIGILFVLSFPPLFGHEIIAVLCGLVWGLGPGFAIVAAGTFLGECGNFFAFRYCCSARGHKMERTNLQYACLARAIREGGLVVALIARFSAIPGHFTTAVFSTCGMSFWTFAFAALLSTPKQLVTVYLGVILEDEDNGGETRKDKIISDAVVVVTVIVTVAAMYYIRKKMHDAVPKVIYDRRKARQADQSSQPGARPYGAGGEDSSTSTIALNAASTSNLPLNTSFQNPSNIYVPQPQRAPFRPSMEAPTHRPQAYGAQAPQQYQMTERYGGQPPQQQSSSNMPRMMSPPRDPFADSSRYAPPPGPPPHAVYSTPFDAPPAAIPKLAPPPSTPRASEPNEAAAYTHSRESSEELSNPFETAAYQVNAPPPSGPPR